MKGRSNIVAGIQNLRMAEDHFRSFCLEHPGSKGARVFLNYIARIQWITRDLFTNPSLTADVRDGIKKEAESDVFSVPAIAEKISLIKPEHREALEDIIDRLLEGYELIVNDNKIMV